MRSAGSTRVMLPPTAGKRCRETSINNPPCRIDDVQQRFTSQVAAEVRFKELHRVFMVELDFA